MKKVIIFGTGTMSNYLKKSLKCEIEIVKYVDNDRSKWGKLHHNIEVINPSSIPSLNYDYILIGSQFNDVIYRQLLEIGVESEKIFQFMKYIDNCSDYVKLSLDRVKNNEEKIETIVTGLSYAEYGIDLDKYNKFAVNIANASQDLYYDYNLIKWILKNYDVKKIKEVVIGLCYYSFEYDLSLSAMKDKTVLYYRHVKLSHNMENVEQLLDGLDESIEIASLIFNFNSENKPIIYWNNSNQIYKPDEIIGKKQAHLDCSKDYPKTVKENTIIFREYLQLLKDYNINAVVAVFPASNYYTKHFSSRIEQEFNEIINKVGEEYNFQYIDYFRSELFGDSDFRDVSHLNQKGAGKFTKILNEIIK